MFDFSTVTNWLHELMLGAMPAWLVTTIECALVALFLLLAYSVLAMIYICGFAAGWGLVRGSGGLPPDKKPLRPLRSLRLTKTTVDLNRGCEMRSYGAVAGVPTIGVLN